MSFILLMWKISFREEWGGFCKKNFKKGNFILNVQIFVKYCRKQLELIDLKNN